MISLASECLLVQMASGEAIPCSAEMMCVEVEGDVAGMYNTEFVNHATKAVFHYFKHELGRQEVSAKEFAGALEKVLRGFALAPQVAGAAGLAAPVAEADLRLIASDCGHGRELVFFPRLRDELRRQLRQGPRVLRFRGLRGCVKQLVGARRWSGRCQVLQSEIVAFLRECLKAEPAQGDVALWVE